MTPKAAKDSAAAVDTKTSRTSQPTPATTATDHSGPADHLETPPASLDTPGKPLNAIQAPQVSSERQQALADASPASTAHSAAATHSIPLASLEAPPAPLDTSGISLDVVPPQLPSETQRALADTSPVSAINSTAAKAGLLPDAPASSSNQAPVAVPITPAVLLSANVVPPGASTTFQAASRSAEDANPLPTSSDTSAASPMVHVLKDALAASASGVVSSEPEPRSIKGADTPRMSTMQSSSPAATANAPPAVPDAAAQLPNKAKVGCCFSFVCI